MNLIRTYMEIIKRGDSNYILNKGANCYIQKDYKRQSKIVQNRGADKN